MLSRDLRSRGISDPDVLEAMAEIRREAFVLPEYHGQAYDDGPLPIGAGQTISQPYIVGLMTQLLRLKPDLDVLEVGTGCGYQTAVLARLVERVYTIETLEELSDSARATLQKLGIDNVTFHVGDGSEGWPERRSFDRIIITAATPNWPKPLVDQLIEGGEMVAPLGGISNQMLVVAEKRLGKLIERSICGCRFVKLLGEYGFHA